MTKNKSRKIKILFSLSLSVFIFAGFAGLALSAPNEEVSLKVSRLGDGFGSVTISSSGTDLKCDFNKNDKDSYCRGNYPKGADITITAVADSNSTFIRWSGDCSVESSVCTFKINNDKEVKAFFSLGSDNNNSSSANIVNGIIASPNPVSYGKSATLTWAVDESDINCYLYSPTDNLKTIKSDALYLENSTSRFYKGPGYYAVVDRNSNGTTANLTATTDYILLCATKGTVKKPNNYDLTVSVTGSKKFVIGDLIYATDNVSVRDTSSLSGVILGRQNFGSLGKIVGGPVGIGSYSWWKIDYNNTPDGWSAENYLEKRGGSSSSLSNLSGNLSGKGETFGYTGNEQKYIVPSGVTSVNIKAYGAQGESSGTSGGLGGFAEANISVSPGETLYVYVGGQSGWNGGGKGSPYTYSGGGASDVRQGGAVLSTNRIIVAGGGGGSGTRTDTYYGGSGGGLAGEDGSDANGASGGRGATNLAGGIAGSTGGHGATLRNSTSGTLGKGGDGGFNNCSSYGGGGGGGGGYYGGGGGGGKCAGGAAGGGGSSFVPSGGMTLSNSRQGEGQVIITANSAAGSSLLSKLLNWTQNLFK